MEIVDIVLVLLVLVVIVLLVQKFSTQKKTRSTGDKKSELINNYEQRMKTLLIKYKDDDTKKVSEKTKLLKQISAELSTNIYFDKEDVKALLQKLANMH